MNKITLSLYVSNQRRLPLLWERFNYSSLFNNVSLLMTSHVLFSLARPLIMSPPFNNTVISRARTFSCDSSDLHEPGPRARSRFVRKYSLDTFGNQMCLMKPWMGALEDRMNKNQHIVSITEKKGYHTVYSLWRHQLMGWIVKSSWGVWKIF